MWPFKNKKREKFYIQQLDKAQENIFALQAINKDFQEKMIKKDSIYQNLLTNQGTASDVNESTRIKNFHFFSFLELESLYSLEPSINKIISKITETVFKETVYIDSDDEYYKEKFDRKLREHDLHRLLVDLYEAAMVFGHAFFYIDVEDGLKPEDPLDLSKIKRIKSIRVINRYFLVTMPQETDFNFSPLYYYVINQPLVSQADYNQFNPKIGVKIHHTRLIGCWGTKLQPYFFRSNLHFHDSYIRKIKQSCLNYRVAIDNLSSALSQLPLKKAKIKNLMNVLSNPEQRQAFAAKMAERERLRSTHNVSVMDTEEEYDFFWPTLAGLADTLKHIEECMILDSDVPHDVLFGEGSHGATTGRTEKTNFQKFISAQQKLKIEPIIEFFMQLFEAVYGLKIPDVARVSFDHYEEPTETERAAILAQDAGACVALESQGYDCSAFLADKYPLIKKDLSFSELENSKNISEEIRVEV